VTRPRPDHQGNAVLAPMENPPGSLDGWRLGVDVGGTFTDAVLIDGHGRQYTRKVPSTPSDLSVGLLRVIDQVIADASVAPDHALMVTHGTTVATNALIQAQVARAALIVTAGFRDILEIGFQVRPKLFDLYAKKGRPLIPRSLCFEVTERLGPDGNVLTPLVDADVYRIAERLRVENVTSVAVCLLHSYANGAHEQRVAALLRQVNPDLYVTLSSQVCPEFREYPRASSSAINAGLLPIIDGYLARVEHALADRDIACGLQLMCSNGGTLPSPVIRTQPINIVESGPAAGVMAAVFVGKMAGLKDVIAFDMGGTTAKCALVLGARPRIVSEIEVGSKTTKTSLTRGDGYPLRISSIDLAEVGAGGGSIAWVDSGRLLRVGPRSAGASPGPACYPGGGREPTVTDANLVLGRLNPQRFLGGEMILDAEAARKAISAECGDRLRHDVVPVAAAIVSLAVAGMVNAIRLITVERGYDPRELSLVVTGGAGPLHANLLAQALGIREVVIPASPAVGSALGLLVTDVHVERKRSWLTSLSNTNWERVWELLAPLAAEVEVSLLDQGFTKDRIELEYFADMRYEGQSHELRIRFPPDADGPCGMDPIRELFLAEHDRAYGFSVAQETIEITTLQVLGIGQVLNTWVDALQPHTHVAAPSNTATRNASTTRPVYFEELEGFIQCPIWTRDLLAPGCTIEGPAIMEESTSTTLILHGYHATIDNRGTVWIRAGHS